MSDDVYDTDLVVSTVREILTGHEPTQLTPERRWDAALWTELAEAGLTGVGLPEEAGGSGGELADAVAVVATLASGAGAVPAAEQLLVAGPAVLAAGLPLPDPSQPLSVAVSGALTVDDGGRLTGTATDVAWAGVVHWLAVVAQGRDGEVLALVDVSGLEATHAANLAGEPRGSYVFDGVPAQVGPLPADLRARYALARAVQLSAAAETVLAWTVQYAGERQQFGRPLARFQGIQMQLAQMAGEVTAVAALVDAAVQRLDRGEPLELAAAAAKVRAGAAVEVVARQAHQVHGAIGFTQEHRLHHLTKRMWSWRDEAGNELTWARVLGAAVATDAPWAVLTTLV
ncbi:acyl-CoA dehydrogenase family protein [Modestobacter sp. Leaf380]|uniref:acyl-CoA dehydrogenase family protein n=1 Tax=Modestobacter sp. Leaf380 TaxID=1736356 RepID=UPI0006FD0F15|nr:acyl-CoA dehydrogenase family protein [Modestobacter sp. Leaf380]KQS69157.1 acyl-CoA dehydrogenase [Modestobacter sp. Leaf380]